MARLQELQYTVTGGNKVISGVTLSPRSTRGYLKTSLRCKQESLRYPEIRILTPYDFCTFFSFYSLINVFLTSLTQFSVLIQKDQECYFA